MSESTPDIPPSAPSTPSPPPQPPPVSPHPYPPPHDYQQPPARPIGCKRFAIFGLVTLFVLGVIGVCTLVGTIFLFAVGTDVFDVLSSEMQEKAVTEKLIGGNPSAEDKIVIMSIEGIITSNADGFVVKQIRRVVSDPKVKAVVLRVDSPGGTMAGSDYYLHLLKKMKTEKRIPVVVSMGSIATSGGYYVSMIGNEIYAEPSTITGSIGVIASLFDASELLKKVGIESTPITSGVRKTMGSFMKPMSEEERAIWQNLIDENFDRFKKIIREGRREFRDNPADLDKLATGQIYTANEAVSNKLIDKIGFLDDAVAQAGRLANLAEREYKVVQYRAKLSFVETLLENRTPNNLLSGKTLSEMSTPKVYLVCPHVIPIDGGK